MNNSEDPWGIDKDVSSQWRQCPTVTTTEADSFQGSNFEATNTDIVLAVIQHLDMVISWPGALLDDTLLEAIDICQAELMSEHDRARLLEMCVRLFRSMQPPASALARLIHVVVRPDVVGYFQIASLCIDVLTCLESTCENVNLIGLTILIKASHFKADIEVALTVPVVRACITLWLATSNKEVASVAQELLTKLILKGIPNLSMSASKEYDTLTRVLFGDDLTYGMLFSLSGLKEYSNVEPEIQRRKKVVQQRLVNLLIDIDHEASPIRRSLFREIESFWGVVDPTQGLLSFAFLEVANTHGNHMFTSMYIHTCKRYLTRHSSMTERSLFALSFLKRHGYHAECMSYWLRAGLASAPWLTSDSAQYIAQYCSVYPDDLVKDEELAKGIRWELHQHLHTTRILGTDFDDALKDDLDILSGLPRVVHLWPGCISPLKLVPLDALNEHVMIMLRRIFFEADTVIEQRTARTLYFTYYIDNPELWARVVEKADCLELPILALSAIEFMTALLTAQWVPPRPDDRKMLPEKTRLKLHAYPCTDTGLETMLSELRNPPVRDYFLGPKQKMRPPIGEGSMESYKINQVLAHAKNSLILEIATLMEAHRPTASSTRFSKDFQALVASRVQMVL